MKLVKNCSGKISVSKEEQEGFDPIFLVVCDDCNENIAITPASDRDERMISAEDCECEVLRDLARRLGASEEELANTGLSEEAMRAADFILGDEGNPFRLHMV